VASPIRPSFVTVENRMGSSITVRDLRDIPMSVDTTVQSSFLHLVARTASPPGIQAGL
jgi:hypothetical protein